MMCITQPLSEQLFEAYCELFAAVENGIDNDRFFQLRERFRNLQSQVQENATEQERLKPYRTFAYDKYNDDGHLEIEDSAIVSVSEDGGAYVEAWIWVSNEDLPDDGSQLVKALGSVVSQPESRSFLNTYDCPCGAHWEDEWNCACDDRCPKCDTSCSPTQSQEV